MEKSVDYMVHEFSSRANRQGFARAGRKRGRRSYGSAMKLKQLALITTPEPRLLVVQPFDAGTVQDIEKALKESKIGITPLVDGKIIRLPIPELSEERRKDLVKIVQARWPRKRASACARTAAPRIDEAKKLQNSRRADRRRFARSGSRRAETDRSIREINRRTLRAQRSRSDEGVRESTAAVARK